MTDGEKRPIVLVAMGGHAFMKKGERGTIEDHVRNADAIAALLMTLVERDYHLVITHGNGPQVGSLLLQNECTRDEVPPMPQSVATTQSSEPSPSASASSGGTTPSQSLSSPSQSSSAPGKVAASVSSQSDLSSR